jgi:hypothetical protein
LQYPFGLPLLATHLLLHIHTLSPHGGFSWQWDYVC